MAQVLGNKCWTGGESGATSGDRRADLEYIFGSVCFRR